MTDVFIVKNAAVATYRNGEAIQLMIPFSGNIGNRSDELAKKIEYELKKYGIEKISFATGFIGGEYEVNRNEDPNDFS